jgi:hypothetical protein
VSVSEDELQGLNRGTVLLRCTPSAEVRVTKQRNSTNTDKRYPIVSFRNGAIDSRILGNVGGKR